MSEETKDQATPTETENLPNAPTEAGQPDDEATRAAAYREKQGKSRAQKDGGAAQVDAEIADEHAKGYVGTVPDPTPNEHYTVAGVIAGKPTPETDAQQAATAAQASRDLAATLTTPKA